MAHLLLPTFKAVTLIFAISAVGTGLQALVAPIAFARSFGIAIDPHPAPPNSSSSTTSSSPSSSVASAYVSLMGVRQLGTGLTLLTFASQGKWNEAATLLAIIGIVVAGTDGVFLARSGERERAVFHALPGALIAALAGAVVYYESA